MPFSAALVSFQDNVHKLLATVSALDYEGKCDYYFVAICNKIIALL